VTKKVILVCRCGVSVEVTQTEIGRFIWCEACDLISKKFVLRLAQAMRRFRHDSLADLLAVMVDTRADGSRRETRGAV